MLEESTKLKVAIEVVAQDEIKIIEDFLATLEVDS